MAWSYWFKKYLKTFPDKTEVGNVYAPEFRLQIGTPFVSGNHMGKWESSGGTKCLEISSHPFSSSINPKADYHERGTHPTGHDYLYCVGLNDRITFGKQSVNPRTFVYTGSTLSCEVTQYAASAAAECLIGTLAIMQIRFPPDVMGEDVDHEMESSWQNIFVGVYQGMKWNGQAYSLNFNDALAAARQNTTDPEMSVNQTDSNMWFKGCGVSAKVKETSTTFTEGRVLTDIPDWDRYEVAFGKTGNIKDSSMWGWDEMHRQFHTDAESINTMWASIRNTTGNTTWVAYSYINVSVPTTGGAFSYVNLKDVNSYAGFSGYYPGRKTSSAAVTLGGVGADSTITPVCVISGSPVQAFVNTVYVRAYHHNMVPGIFGPKFDEVYNESIINRDDIYFAQSEFEANFARCRPGVVYSDGTTSSFDAPFKMVVSKPTSNGLGLMSKSCGKWGVHPRFKEGGYGMACYPAAKSVLRLEEEIARRAAINVVYFDEIEGAEWVQQDDSTKTTYKGGRYVTSANDSPAAGTETHTTATDATVRPWVTAWKNDDFEYFDMPLQGSVTFTTNDCAEGSVDDTSVHFTEIMKNTHKYVYGNAHMGVTVRLVGLKHAHIAPGDFLDIYSDSDTNVEIGHVEWGPVNAGKTYNPSFLATLIDAPLSSYRRAGNPYFVKSTHVDWVRGIVTLEMTRGYDTTAKRRGEWGKAWGRSTETVSRNIADDMGMPLFNDDIDETPS